MSPTHQLIETSQSTNYGQKSSVAQHDWFYTLNNTCNMISVEKTGLFISQNKYVIKSELSGDYQCKERIHLAKGVYK